MALRLDHVTKEFQSNGGEVIRAVDGVDLEILDGEFVAIVGHNGSGKSTLLDLIAGEHTPDAGSINMETEEGRVAWARVPRAQRAAYIYRVQQEPRRGTVSEFTVEENLALSQLRMPRPSWWRRGVLDLQAVSGTTGLFRRKSGAVAAQLSGGERQLLALEIAFARRPRILLLDECTASLDPENARRCLAATKELWTETRVTVIMVTHDFAEAHVLANRVIALREGRVVQDLFGDELRNMNEVDLYARCR